MLFKNKRGILVGAFAVAFAICGTGNVIHASANSKATSSNSPYLVGIVLPETGSSAASGTDMFNAAKLAVKKINSSGGILKHPVQLVEEDDACDPQTAVNAANKVVSLNVQAVIDGYCSGAVLPSLPIYNRAGIPVVDPAANSSALVQQGDHNLFVVNSLGNDQARTAAQFMVKVLHAKKIALLNDQSAYGENLTSLTKAQLQNLRQSVADYEGVPATLQDFSSLIYKYKSEHIDAIYWTGYYAQGGLLIKQARQLGYKGAIMVADGSVDNVLISTAGNRYANGVYATMSPMPPFLRGVQATDFTKAYTSAYHTQPGPYSALTYDSLMVLQQSAKNAHSIDPAKVINALHAVHYTGITGPISFAANGARKNARFLVLEVKNGKFTLAPTQP